MAEEALSSLWSYDLDPSYNSGAIEASKTPACPVSTEESPDLYPPPAGYGRVNGEDLSLTFGWHRFLIGRRQRLLML